MQKEKLIPLHHNFKSLEFEGFREEFMFQLADEEFDF